MPARKPSTLNKRHEAKSKRSARSQAEDLFTPRSLLPAKAPEPLRKHKVASDAWEHLIALYGETQGRIATAFDADTLIKYCLLGEECLQLEGMRGEIHQLWRSETTRLEKIKPNADDLGTYYMVLNAVHALLGRFQGMDARLDGKRKLLHTLAQSLYLTPRSRAGVAPPERPAPEPKSAIDKALDGD